MPAESHALLGASNARQWLGCPPSIRFVEYLDLPDEESPFAAEGTEAHALAELKLRLAFGQITKRQYSSRVRSRKKSEYYGAEMEEATDTYVSFVTGLADALGEESGETPMVDLEQRVDFSAYVPAGYGTADCIVVDGTDLHVIDLKYGKGVAVSAEDNPQLKLYALGALERYGMLYGIETVITTIVQPRLGSVSSDSYPVGDLVSWGRDYVAPRAELAFAGEGEYHPGEDTCRWCRAKGVCRARADEALKAACSDFSVGSIPTPGEAAAKLAAPPDLSDGEVARLLAVCPLIEDWCKGVRADALERALSGTAFDGYKVVAGRSSRKIADTASAIAALQDAGVPEGDYLKPRELQGIGALTKALGKEKFEELLGPLVVKPQGKPTLVPDDDKRPALGSAESAAADFAD